MPERLSTLHQGLGIGEKALKLRRIYPPTHTPYQAALDPFTERPAGQLAGCG